VPPTTPSKKVEDEIRAIGNSICQFKSPEKIAKICQTMDFSDVSKSDRIKMAAWVEHVKNFGLSRSFDRLSSLAHSPLKETQEQQA
jgi:hypothetical protein